MILLGVPWASCSWRSSSLSPFCAARACHALLLLSAELKPLTAPAPVEWPTVRGLIDTSVDHPERVLALRPQCAPRLPARRSIRCPAQHIQSSPIIIPAHAALEEKPTGHDSVNQVSELPAAPPGTLPPPSLVTLSRNVPPPRPGNEAPTLISPHPLGSSCSSSPRNFLLLYRTLSIPLRLCQTLY